MENIIRKAEAKDLITIQSIAVETIRKCYKVFLTEEMIERFIGSGESDKEFEKYFDNLYVLEDNGKIPGFCIYFENFLHILMVDVNIQRGGLGSLLLKHVERELTKNGNKLLKLETFKENRQAMNFYTKHGWKVVRSEEEKELNVTRVFFEKEV
jgi:ribosomal protein S18 acetylase RimI-like enzyme